MTHFGSQGLRRVSNFGKRRHPRIPFSVLSGFTGLDYDELWALVKSGSLRARFVRGQWTVTALDAMKRFGWMPAPQSVIQDGIQVRNEIALDKHDSTSGKTLFDEEKPNFGQIARANSAKRSEILTN